MTRAACLLTLITLAIATSASAQTASSDAARMERGRVVHDYWCATCHSAGRGMPGTAALAVKYENQPAVPPVLSDRTNLTPASIKFFVRNGVSVMPFFRKTEIGDADLEALTMFLMRNRKP